VQTHVKFKVFYFNVVQLTQLSDRLFLT